MQNYKLCQAFNFVLEKVSQRFINKCASLKERKSILNLHSSVQPIRLWILKIPALCTTQNTLISPNFGGETLWKSIVSSYVEALPSSKISTPGN